MAEIVNLRQHRKTAKRAEAADAAAANRAKFGRTKAEKQAEVAQQVLAAAKLDGHKRDR